MEKPLMHVIQNPILRFNPKEQSKEIQEIFEDRTATILWCGIRGGHVTSQYFNQNVLKVAKEFDKKSYRTDYDEFLKVAHVLTATFGQATVYETTMTHNQRIDNEFWGEMFRILIRQRAFEYKVVKIQESKGHGKAGKGLKKTSTIQVVEVLNEGFLLMKQFRFKVEDSASRLRAEEYAEEYVKELICESIR